ncbi:hypothetical protein J4H92_12395 [Leucobacter weissii]|uniref:Uncharacterized protein n=1 Tax=Leucobacter weissii TaxID=1983706 RepID=A0A939MMS9_9MICO|nr:hypothetical protein [Leucobacter weissii]MBO1902745.1 hypothetical protein [Leucobacter weissii]
MSGLESSGKADDATVGVPGGPEATRAADGEETLRAPRDETVVVGDETVVAGGADAPARVVQRRSERTVFSGPRPGDPVPEPEGSSGPLGRGTGRVQGEPVGLPLDAERRIGPVPERKPWEQVIAAEPGVTPGLPVPYAPRAVEAQQPFRADVDEIMSRLGPPPAARPVPVGDGREDLPSLRRRGRRSRVVTLTAYGAVLVLAALGLWGVALLAFG